MKSEKVKILLDADVVIHFIKGGCLSLLPDILPAYQFAILDIVLDRELRRHPQTCTQLNNHIRILKNIEVIGWLIKTLGVGESASMVYCKYHPNVLASSNLRDIKSYCEQNRITYLSTMDLLYLACHRKVMTEQACDRFIADVLRQGSKLPVSKLSLYMPRAEVFSL